MLLIVVLGFVIVGVVAVKPKIFWPMLIVVTVGTAGLMVPTIGICLVDEYLAVCVLIGGLLVISMRPILFRKGQRDDLSYLHMLAFFFMIIYMVIQSARGLLLWGDWRLSRWVIYYVMLGMLSFVISRDDFLVPNRKKMLSIILWSALVYFAAYLAHGLYTQIVRGFSYASPNIQGVEWSGSTYAVFPLVVVMPAVIFLFKDSARSQRCIGWAVIIIALIIGYFYDSRSAWISVLAFMIVSPTLLRVRQTALWMLIFGGLTFFFYGYFIDFLRMLVMSAALHEVSEAGRLMQVRAAFSAVSTDWITLFFGYGIHSHHFVIGPYLGKIGYSSISSSDYVRVSGFSGLLVDTGLIGILLLGANFLFTALKILTQKKTGRIILLLALFLVFIWLIISKIEDIVLFYLMIMPSGLLVQLSKYRTMEQSLEGKRL